MIEAIRELVTWMKSYDLDTEGLELTIAFPCLEDLQRFKANLERDLSSLALRPHKLRIRELRILGIQIRFSLLLEEEK